MIDEIRILSCSEPALLYSPPAETRLTVYRRLNIPDRAGERQMMKRGIGK